MLDVMIASCAIFYNTSARIAIYAYTITLIFNVKTPYCFTTKSICGKHNSFLSKTVRGFYTPEKLAQILPEAGFSKVEILPLTLGAVAIHRAVK
ncbi:MAG: class I SAM-dependent methyltransferase [Elusimicrobia bacterium]|nr:class I SAM-dependent methyltransferase [Elusimicrobiota bacterium]